MRLTVIWQIHIELKETNCKQIAFAVWAVKKLQSCNYVGHNKSEQTQIQAPQNVKLEYNLHVFYSAAGAMSLFFLFTDNLIIYLPQRIVWKLLKYTEIKYLPGKKRNTLFKII